MLGASLDNGQVTDYYDGLLDEWGIYSRALTEGEIERLMGGGLVRGLGQLDGYITATTDGSPINAATIVARGGDGWNRFSTTDAAGYYNRTLLAASYTVTASAYGYLPSTVTDLEILTNTVTTQDFALASAPTRVVSGKISSADQGWSLKAHIEIHGDPVDPASPINDAWTDPVTGEYSITLAEGVKYTFHVEAQDHIAQDIVIGPLTSNETLDLALLLDFPRGCPPGYTTMAIFADGFESGALGPSWRVYTTTQGRVRIDSAYAYAGSYSVLLDASLHNNAGAYSFAATILEQDLAGLDQVVLDFAWESFSDESHPGDGVFISDDLGATWFPVFSFNMGPASFQDQGIDVSAAAAANGLTLNDHFWIKFQYYDDYPIAADGYAIDEVMVRGCMSFAAGRVAGYAYDDNTGLPLWGAVVQADGGQSIITGADGFYETVEATGSRVFTATYTSGYVPDVHLRTVAAGDTIRQDFRLAAGLPNVHPGSMAVTLMKGLSATLPLTVSNLGGAELGFSVQDGPGDPDWLAADPGSGAVAPLDSQRVDVTFDTRAQEITRLGDFYALLNLSNDSPYGSTQVPVTMTVIAPDLTISKSGPASTLAGDTIFYTISYRNNGNADAFDVRIDDKLPSGVTASGATTWELGDIPAGNSGTIEFLATVDSGLAGGTTLLNKVSITSSNLDINTSNNHDSITTVVVVPLQAGFTSTTPDFLGQDTHFTNDTIGYPVPTYAWDFGDGGTSTTVDPTHVYQAVGTYTVTLVATNSAGSDAFVDPVRIVDVPPSASFFFDTHVEVGETSQFHNTSTGTNLDFVWDFGDGNTGMEKDPAHAYQTEGVYTVNLTATNSSGADRVSHPITVTLLLPKPVWVTDVSVNGTPAGPLPLTVVASDTIQLVDQVWITFTHNVTFTLMETWTTSLQLVDWGSDSGDSTSSGGMLTWDATNTTANTWHTITRTFRVLSGTWENHSITANLWVEQTDTHLPERIVSLDHLYYGAMLVPSSAARAGGPGTTVVYDLHLSNSGNITDSYALEVTGQSWATAAPPIVGPLAADAGVTVRVEVDIPAGAEGQDVATITAFSQTDPHDRPARVTCTVSTTVTDTFRVFLPTITKNH